MAAFSRDIAEFDRLGAQVLGVSPDSVESHRKFARKLDISFPLLTDKDKKVRALYGPGRITFIIDRQGIVRHIIKGMPDNKELLKELKKLK